MEQDKSSALPRFSQRAGLWLLAALCAMATASAQAASNRLEAVDAVAAGNSQISIRLKLADSAPVPSVFTVNDPARLSIDLPDTALAVSKRYQRIDEGPVQAVAMAASGTRTRVVVEMSEMTRYDINRQGNEIVVRIGGAASGTQTAGQSGSGSATASNRNAVATSSAPTRPARAVQNIDFRRGEKGAGRVKITLDGVNAPVDVSDEGSKIVATIRGVSLPDRLRKRLDVLDFATPVKTIDALASSGNTRIVIAPAAGADFEQLAYQTGNEFFIELQPLTPAERDRKEKEQPTFKGQKISLSFQNIDVRAVLQIIADVAKVNMVVSDSVSGTMALRLEDVPWDQALDIILKAKGLGMHQENNVITVAPLAEIAAREQAELTARQATSNLAPLRSEIIQINYARAADIASILAANRASAPQAGTPGQLGGPAANDQSLLSARGRVTVDERTNSLLVNDTRNKLDEIRRLINRLDIPVRQVLIQARIVVANREFQRNLGVTQDLNDLGAFESSTGGNYIANSGYTVGLPAPNPTSALSTTIIGDTFALDLELSAMESENRGEIISSPRVVTANAKEAKIEQGVEIPYLEAASSGAATVQFKDAVLSLVVTPQITPDERVIMDLFVTQDTQGDSINVQGGGSVPSINTRSLTTQVLVDDGETVVLGGIYELENRDVTNKVPVLGDLPLVGALFRGTQKQRDKRELLLFITPKILRDTLSAR